MAKNKRPSRRVWNDLYERFSTADAGQMRLVGQQRARKRAQQLKTATRPRLSPIEHVRIVFFSMLLTLVGMQLLALVEGHSGIVDMLRVESILVTYALIGVMAGFAALWLRIGAEAAYRIRTAHG